MLDDTFEILSDEYRRGMLYSLNDMDDQAVTYEDLIDEMVDEGYLPEHERERFMVQMEHAHLPKMEDYGFIDYDRRSSMIRPSTDEGLEEVLETVAQFEDQEIRLEK